MFPRTFEQRRLWFRVVFVVAALAPAACVTASIVWRTAHGERARLERELTQAWGLEVAIAELRHPWPGTLVLEGLSLADPETGAPIASAHQVDVESRDGEWVVLAQGVELHLEASRPLWASAQQALARRGGPQAAWHLFTRGFVVRDARGRQSLDDVDVRFQPGESTSELSLAASLPNTPAFEGMHLSVKRNHRSRPPEWRWELMTRDRPFPLAMLAPLVQLDDWLGPRAEFQGYLWVTQRGDDYDARAAGQLRHVDLNQLVTARFPHTLRADDATLAVDDAMVENGRAVKVRGSLSAGAGRVSRSLLHSASQHLGLQAMPAGDGRNELLPFDRLALQFALSDGQLELFAAENPAGQIVTRAGQTLLTAPPNGARVPPIGLLRALAPQSEHQAPATRETELLARLLPIPSVAPPPDAQGAAAPVSARLIRAVPTTR